MKEVGENARGADLGRLQPSIGRRADMSLCTARESAGHLSPSRVRRFAAAREGWKDA